MVNRTHPKALSDIYETLAFIPLRKKVIGHNLSRHLNYAKQNIAPRTHAFSRVFEQNVIFDFRQNRSFHSCGLGVFKTRNGEIAKWRNDEMAKWN